jgi:uncharacterized protein with GYD domain
MATYVALLNWTDQGVRNIGDAPKRLDSVKKLLADMGGSTKAFYMTIGQFDMVLIYEAPDDAVAAHFTLKLSQSGNVRTQTLKAFPEQSFREILASL